MKELSRLNYAFSPGVVADIHSLSERPVIYDPETKSMTIHVEHETFYKARNYNGIPAKVMFNDGKKLMYREMKNAPLATEIEPVRPAGISADEPYESECYVYDVRNQTKESYTMDFDNAFCGDLNMHAPMYD